MQDSQLIFSDGQNITANATTVDSTNVIDLGNMLDHKGTALNSFGPENGEDRLVISIGVAPSAGTGIQVEMHDCATVGGTYKATGVGLNDAVPNATLVAGYEMLNVPLPRGLREFLKLVFTTTGNHTGSLGTVNARIERGATTKNQTPYRA